MNTSGYLDWPFRPQQRSDEQGRQWWLDCYMEAAADRQLRGLYHWGLLAGPPGSGKSTALTAWRAREANHSLVLDYPPERWPGARTAWHPRDPSHLTQMLAVAGEAVADILSRKEPPALAAGLDPFQREFLRALLERQGGELRYRRFVRGLPPELRESYQNVATATDFFGDSGSKIGIQAIIQELTLLVEALGRRRVVYVVDPDPPLDADQMAGLGDLFGWLDLADSPAFVVVAAVGDGVLRASDVLARARARASLIYTDWTAEECREVAAAHLCQALPGAPADRPLAAVMDAQCLALADKLVVEECGQPNPAAWVLLLEAALFAIHRADTRLPAPLTAAHFPALRNLYFARHVTLRLDPGGRGVWRGARLLPIDEQPMRFLQLLQRRERAVNWDDYALRELAGSKNNVHSIASRARKAIEPDPEQPVYLRNRRGDDGGYWVEHVQPPLPQTADVTGL